VNSDRMWPLRGSLLCSVVFLRQRIPLFYSLASNEFRHPVSEEVSPVLQDTHRSSRLQVLCAYIVSYAETMAVNKHCCSERRAPQPPRNPESAPSPGMPRATVRWPARAALDPSYSAQGVSAHPSRRLARCWGTPLYLVEARCATAPGDPRDP
jgi:hypothetical protein